MKKSIFGISLMTITCLYGLLAGLVILITIIAGGEVLYAIIGSIIVLIIQFLIAPWLTDLSMRLFYKADFNASIPDYLKEFIESECKKHNVKYPKIGIINDGGPNAFTYGRTKKDARIILTRGIFDLLEKDEVIAVVGHEMGHIVHMDMMVMTFAQVVPLVLYAIYEALTRIDTDSKNDNASKLQAIGYIAYILYIICQYIILWLSRSREYYADRFSAEETKNPNSLAEALVKVGFGLSTNSSNTKHNVSNKNALGIFDSNSSKALAITTMDKNNKVSKDKIKNAMKWEMWNPWAKWFELNSTHPLISKRLQRLSELSPKYKQEPYVRFDLEKPESYVDDFFIEVLIAFLPIFALIVTFIFGIMVFSSGDIPKYYFGIDLFITTLLFYIKFNRAHRTNYKDTDVSELLGEVKVSHITSVPCILKGTIIGRGNPGCIFNEDFILKDKTGIVFLDYNQPLNIINKIFAIFKSKEYFDKEVTVKGWYRRSPVPYVEIYEYEVDNKRKKIYTYMLSKGLLFVMFAISIGIVITHFI